MIMIYKMDTYSQAFQDTFVVAALRGRRGGVFLELGGNDPCVINNTYLLEKKYGWRGVMVEYVEAWAPAWASSRPGTCAVFADATRVDYTSLDLPPVVDYLQIDLEVENRSTLSALERIDRQLMDTTVFGVVTFEHDIYRGDFFGTRARSREIFERRGYVRVWGDVSNLGNPYEDWYVHPSVVPDYERLVRPAGEASPY